MILDLVSHIDNPVKKHPIVRHDNYGFVVIFQISLQPLNRGEIQMVGRLVQQHDIRSAQQELDKCHLGLLPAGKASDRTFQILQGKSKALKHNLHILPPGIAPKCFHLFLKIVIFIQQSLVLA